MPGHSEFSSVAMGETRYPSLRQRLWSSVNAGGRRCHERRDLTGRIGSSYWAVAENRSVLVEIDGSDGAAKEPVAADRRPTRRSWSTALDAEAGQRRQAASHQQAAEARLRRGRHGQENNSSRSSNYPAFVMALSAPQAVEAHIMVDRRWAIATVFRRSRSGLSWSPIRLQVQRRAPRSARTWGMVRTHPSAAPGRWRCAGRPCDRRLPRFIRWARHEDHRGQRQERDELVGAGRSATASIISRLIASSVNVALVARADRSAGDDAGFARLLSSRTRRWHRRRLTQACVAEGQRGLQQPLCLPAARSGQRCGR